MGKLYIIGNGFDLKLGLKTSYTKDFRRIVYSNYESWAELIDAVFFSKARGDWSDFENQIGRPSIQGIESYCDWAINSDLLVNPITVENIQINIPNILSSLIDALDNSMYQMIAEADNDLEDTAINSKIFKSDDYFLTFNYSQTLEDYFEINPSQICHIHGETIDDGQIWGCGHPYEDLVCLKTCVADLLAQAYGCNPAEIEDKVEYSLKILQEFFIPGAIKVPDLDKLNNFLKNLPHDMAVTSIGHSLSECDRPYFESINQILDPDSWEVSYYSANDSVFSNALDLTFSNKIQFVNSNQFVLTDQ